MLLFLLPLLPVALFAAAVALAFTVTVTVVAGAQVAAEAAALLLEPELTEEPVLVDVLEPVEDLLLPLEVLPVLELDEEVLEVEVELELVLPVEVEEEELATPLSETSNYTKM